MAKKRTNIIPIIHDARKPQDYRFLVGMVDVVFADVAQPDQARIISENAHMYLKNGGKFLISLKANCIDSTNEPEVVFANEVPYFLFRFKNLKSITWNPQNNSLSNPTSEITLWSSEHTAHDLFINIRSTIIKSSFHHIFIP